MSTGSSSREAAGLNADCQWLRAYLLGRFCYSGALSCSCLKDLVLGFVDGFCTLFRTSRSELVSFVFFVTGCQVGCSLCQLVRLVESAGEWARPWLGGIALSFARWIVSP